jgi:hypothetical protein
MSEPKLCPFRKITMPGESTHAKIEEFLPCKEGECAMWRMNGGGYFAVNPPEELIAIMKEAASKSVPVGFCGLAGRP